ncbi:MAG: hypothetical protein ACETWD_05530 [Desulfatiglandales bacterium]
MATGCEDVIYQYPGVKEAAVVGVPDPYRRDGEGICGPQGGDGGLCDT